MKIIQVYDFHDYRAYLKSHIINCEKGKHGEKSRIATAIKCHNAYFSQILAGKADLSLEQTYDLAEYLNLASDETDYLILLVNYGRAGTKKLKDYYFEKIKATEKKRVQLQNRIQPTHQISKEQESIYYSTWYYSVIHLVLTTLQGFDSIPALQKLLKLPAQTIRDALQFLEGAAIIQREGGKYKQGPVDIYLGGESAMIKSHHTQWRMQAIRSLDTISPEETHYSTLVSICKEDFGVIRNLLLKCLEQKRKVVADSKNEDTVAVLTLDWFMLYSS